MRKRLCMLLATIYTLTLVGCYNPRKRDYAAERFQKIEEYMPSGTPESTPGLKDSKDYFKGNDIAVFYADDLTNNTVRYYVTYVSDIKPIIKSVGDIKDVFFEYEIYDLVTEDVLMGNIEEYFLKYSPADQSKSDIYPEIERLVCHYTGNGYHVVKGNTIITTIEDAYLSFSVKERVPSLDIDTNSVVYEVKSEAHYFAEYGSGRLVTLEESDSFIGTFYLDSHRFYTRDELIEFEGNLNAKRNLLKLK